MKTEKKANKQRAAKAVTSRTEKPATSNPSSKHEKSLTAGLLRWWAWLLPLTAVAVAGVAMVMFEDLFLFRVQELNLFLYTPLFLKQQMVVSGGLLTYLGTYFTQYFYHPWMGVTMLCCWWLLLMWLTKHAFAIPNKWMALTLIPAVALLISDMDLGYWIFYLKARGHFFAGTIGACVSVAMVWGYRALPGRWFLRTAFIPVSVAVFYPLFGFYALLGAALMGIVAWRVEGYKQLCRCIDTAAVLVAVGLIPLLYYYCWFYQTNIVNIYWTGLPLFRLDKDYYTYYIPYYILGASLALLALAFSRKPKTEGNQQSVEGKKALTTWFIAQLLIVGGVVYAGYTYWYKDYNFHKELKMNRLVEQQDWEGVLSLARDNKVEGTRMMWLMKNLALIRLGRAGDEMFHYPNGAKKCEAPFWVRMTQSGGKILYYNYGQLNFCYRWCLEDGVEYGWRIDYYKHMLKCSILNGEMTVAQKYVDILKQTKYYREWAEHYETFIKKPALIKQDKEFAAIIPFMKTQDVLTSDNTLIEMFLLDHFLRYEGNDPLLQEMSLIAALQMKDIQLYWPRFFNYATLHVNEHMPIHYQEAALLYGNLEHEVDISKMPFDPEVKATFQDFMTAAQQTYAGMTEQQMKPLMYDRFGNTFFYEYFFTRGQRSY
ncbi:MAG: hypothetical protein J5971_07520 [Prevotella sp.]|nr:hypothetical protein [Prevotella sp.]